MFASAPSTNVEIMMTMMMMIIIIITELIRTWQLQRAHLIPPVLSTTGIILNKLQFEAANLRPAVCILMQKAVALNTYRIVRKFWQNSE